MLQYLSSAKKLQTLKFQELCSADPRLLGPTQYCVGGGERMNETHLSVFHSFSNRARGRRSRNSISSSVRFQSFLFLSRAFVKRLYDIHVT